ncbi:MAG: TetR/AcrR family transcriptional regulator C-terminal domain-containing protein [Erysipelothrix sp.]
MTYKRNTTTLAIYHGLFELLESANFDSISVNDICQTSLISRTTFYSYFEDKYQLVLYCFSEERNKLDIVKGVSIDKNLLVFLSRIKEKQSIYHNLFTSTLNRELNQMVASQIEETIESLVPTTMDKEKRDVILNLYSGGIVYTIMKWIDSGCLISEVTLADTLYQQLKKI